MSRRGYVDADDDAPSGRPVRGAAEPANPALAAPALRPEDLPRLTGSAGRLKHAGTGDAQPLPERAGCRQTLQYASRRGDRLYHLDGRVTDLDGNPIPSTGVQRQTLPPAPPPLFPLRRGPTT